MSELNSFSFKIGFLRRHNALYLFLRLKKECLNRTLIYWDKERKEVGTESKRLDSFYASFLSTNRNFKELWEIVKIGPTTNTFF